MINYSRVCVNNCVIGINMKSTKVQPSAEFGGNIGIFRLKTPLHAYV